MKSRTNLRSLPCMASTRSRKSSRSPNSGSICAKETLGSERFFPMCEVLGEIKVCSVRAKYRFFYTSYSHAVGLAESGTTMTKTIFLSCIPTRLLVIRYVIAKVHHGALVYWRDPDRVHPYVDQVVQPGLDALQVANAVAVRVLERAGVDLVRKTKCP